MLKLSFLELRDSLRPGDLLRDSFEHCANLALFSAELFCIKGKKRGAVLINMMLIRFKHLANSI